MLVVGDDGEVTLEDHYDDILMDLELAEVARNDELCAAMREDAELADEDAAKAMGHDCDVG